MTQVLQVSQGFIERYPGAHGGALVLRGAANAATSAALEEARREVEAELRARYGGLDRAALKALPTLAAYDAFYGSFGKSYHVLLQLESVVLKGKSAGRGEALLQAMFLAELKNQLLTAGHDLATVRLPVTLEVATGEESYTLLGGQPATLKAGDMFMGDGEGVISSVLYGPDGRTRMGPTTRDALYLVYAPRGIAAEDVRRHLEDIAALVRLAAPAAQVESLQVVPER
ncbi:MAG TPA: hypothetical protein PLN42_06380 [Anaerolineae bacterium]|nr:hypothetical protein [Anaerolineae bacterium]